ncbi:MAG TPA: EAL domain-containing protein [Thermoanaerobaculia bacterium]|jgi:diguanylate cyclase (GGDEF)-like protein|nr:EAL domain-containing protein [Thermoanaerobaculia bacterium]
MDFHRPARYTARVVALAAALTALSLLALRLQPGSDISLVYPATGLGAALLWGFGVRWWPAVVIAQFALSYRASHSVWVASFVSATELLVILLFCAVVLRYRVSRSLDRLRDLGIFVTTVLLTPVVGGIATAIGESILVRHPLDKLFDDALSFWLSDFVSMLIFVPLVLGWRKWPFTSRAAFQRWLALAVLLMTLGAVIAERGVPASNTLFLLLPIVVFTALVAGIPGASAAGAILLFILLGIGGLQHLSRTDAIIRVIFIGTATATGYILAVIWREREQGALRLFHLAHHDSLTGMYNRHELETRLQKAAQAGPPQAHALLYLDLDQFKLVNDTCGHMAGDRMLQELSGELERALPRNATFARLGGDEFACILLHASEESALEVSDAIHKATERYRFQFGAMSFAVGVSIGITFFPDENGDSADDVLGRADVACYVAKEDGRHRSHVYLPRDEVMLKWHSSIQEVSQLENAMDNGGFRLYRQSIVDLDGGPATNFHEVLLRLVSPSNGTVRTSAEFLPAAQRFGLMDRIDRWVLERSCRHLGDRGDRALKLSVNVSGSTLNDPSFFELVVAAPDKYGFHPDQLCLEVTEGVMIHRLRQAVEAMKGLRERGFDLALDDFGAGVASFAYLQELPVTYVKLDGRIVRGLGTDPGSEVIIGSLVRLAKLRNIDCIAEWVENQAAIDILKSLGVRYAQGFFLEMPAPL